MNTSAATARAELEPERRPLLTAVPARRARLAHEALHPPADPADRFAYLRRSYD